MTRQDTPRRAGGKTDEEGEEGVGIMRTWTVDVTVKAHGLAKERRKAVEKMVKAGVERVFEGKGWGDPLRLDELERETGLPCVMRAKKPSCGVEGILVNLDERLVLGELAIEYMRRCI